MAVVSISKGQALYSCNEPASRLGIILKGNFQMSIPGFSYSLGKGEVCGICDLTSEVYTATCVAMEDSSVMLHDVSDLSALQSLLSASPDYGMIILRSAFKQMNQLLSHYEKSRLFCNSLFSDCSQIYEFYQNCCSRNGQKPRNLEHMDLLSPCPEDSETEPWSIPFYEGFASAFSTNEGMGLFKDSRISCGLIAILCRDFLDTCSSLDSFLEYQEQIFKLFLRPDLDDLYDSCTALCLKLGADSADHKPLLNKIHCMEEYLSKSEYAKSLNFTQRISDFNNSLGTLGNGKESGKEEQDGNPAVLTYLADSLQAILNYSDTDADFCFQFKQNIKKYKDLPDKNSGEDEARLLCNTLTSSFYTLYRSVFFKAADDKNMPLPVRMFLYFGYLDEELAGLNQAVFLSHAAEVLSQSDQDHVYTFFDWVNAIYHGEKDPSRNEFDEDYTSHIHTQKVKGAITAQEEAALLADVKKKAEYELDNMFQTVNKITFGRVSGFCPVFSQHNCLKSLDSAQVSADVLMKTLKNLISLDYSVLYREYVYSNPDSAIQKEFFHVEILPDFILMPCVGIRPVMWQEIEGRKRTTPARMMLPIFYLEDFNAALIRLLGEYRWEMCKRVQGARWNDVSERSLTSEYFDYIQFYKKNHELSNEAKEKIKNTLQKSHNSFKEMFVRDYLSYMLYESTGSPRLTKPARVILFSYCPFSVEVRNKLESNPMCKEMLDRYAIKYKQQLHRLDLLVKKLENLGKPIPAELSAELEYYKS